MRENSQDDEFERVKRERDRLLEEANDLELEREKQDKTLVNEKVAMKAVVHLDRTLNRLETEKSLSMKTSEQHLFA